jgi:Helix-turn-helix domain
MERFLTMREAAKKLRMSLPTLRRHVRLGTIRCIEKGFGRKRQHVIFAPEHVDEFKERRTLPLLEEPRAIPPTVVSQPAAVLQPTSPAHSSSWQSSPPTWNGLDLYQLGPVLSRRDFYARFGPDAPEWLFHQLMLRHPRRKMSKNEREPSERSCKQRQMKRSRKPRKTWSTGRAEASASGESIRGINRRFVDPRIALWEVGFHGGTSCPPAIQNTDPSSYPTDHLLLRAASRAAVTAVCQKAPPWRTQKRYRIDRPPAQESAAEPVGEREGPMKRTALARVISRELRSERDRPAPSKTFEECFSCGREHQYVGPNANDSGRFCSSRCRELYDAEFPRDSDNPGLHPELMPNLCRHEGWRIVAGPAGVAVGSLHYADFIACCERKRQAKRRIVEPLRPKKSAPPAAATSRIGAAPARLGGACGRT